MFIYESLEHPDPPRPEVEAALTKAGQVLDRWRDDPTGPHPLFPGTNSSFRRRQVNWPEVIKWAQTAVTLAPEREEAHQVLGRALDLGELRDVVASREKKKRIKYNSLFPSGDLSRIPPTHFKVFSNFNNKETGLAIDGDFLTRWGTLTKQEPGMFFQVDLDETRLVGGFSLFLGDFLSDYPRGLKILVSPGAGDWREIRATTFAEYAWCHGQLVRRNTYRFPPVAIRQLKLVQTGADPNYWWSICELEVAEAKKGN